MCFVSRSIISNYVIDIYTFLIEYAIYLRLQEIVTIICQNKKSIGIIGCHYLLSLMHIFPCLEVCSFISPCHKGTYFIIQDVCSPTKHPLRYFMPQFILPFLFCSPIILPQFLPWCHHHIPSVHFS